MLQKKDCLLHIYSKSKLIDIFLTYLYCILMYDNISFEAIYCYIELIFKKISFQIIFFLRFNYHW